MQLGFVIDHSRCIGCHACTVACKAENDVPLGDFRTWVKYTESGEFPEVSRSFAVLRCNQCTDAPCMTICPVSALTKADNGIVDVDPQLCIGCKSCMHGCPYDALYINENKGIAEKCNFCAHRTEIGLAPACAIVCPTEAIIPGDLDDPTSRAAQLVATGDLSRRKVEAGTGPNVWYRDVDPAGITPSMTNSSSGYIWSDRQSTPQHDAEDFEASITKTPSRTVYDVPRKLLWGNKITGYLFAKSLAAGIFPMAWGALRAADVSAAGAGLVSTILAMVFLGITGGLLVGDLKRPERFLKIILHPNWDSWLARGSFVILAYSIALAAWGGIYVFGIELGSGVATSLAILTSFLGFFTAAYTGFLFGQARGRVLWMKRGYWFQLIVQAVLAGAATLLILQPALGWSEVAQETLGSALLLSLALHFILTLIEGRLAPKGREEEYHRAARLITHGPYSRQHWLLGVLLGLALPMALLLIPGHIMVWSLAGACALIGLWSEEDVFVRAGQTLPIS